MPEAVETQTTQTGTTTARRTRRVALAGNPNVGKTTVFNLLTGLHQKVGNYPGVTVEKKVGRLMGTDVVEVVDLPGTYSLNPNSLDEQVAYDVLTGRLKGEPVPDLVVCVVDATNLERNLFLATQVMDLGLPTIVALNMMDGAEANGVRIDVDALSKALGAPVVPMTATRRHGLPRLREVLLQDLPAPTTRQWTLMPSVAAAVDRLGEVLAAEAPGLDGATRFSEALRALGNDALLEARREALPGFYRAVLAEREALDARKTPYRQAEAIGRYGWLSPLVGEVVHREADGEQTLSDRIDAVVTHRVFGIVIFLSVLLLMFQAIFTWATPLMDLIEAGVAFLGTAVRATLPAGFVADLMVDGVIAGVGNVVIFLPQILLLFFFLGLMEDTGYMARTAFIMDRVMRRVGLSGGAVVPLLSSFACAIPGIMAARTLDNHRDRVVTIMVAPLMSCSARLPIYTLFIAAFIPAGSFLGLVGYQGLAMFSMYVLGIVMAFAAAWVLKKVVFKGGGSYFVMELPPYRLPQLRLVFWRMVERAKAFVWRAGKIIFGMSIVLWFLASFPRTTPGPDWHAERAQAVAAYEAMVEGSNAEAAAEAAARVQTLDDAAAGEQVRNSYIGRMGRALEPVMRPLGFDWKLSAGIITALAAREVIISTLATLYSVGDADETSVSLKEALKADRNPATGAPVYNTLVAISLLLFFVLALQCMSTLAIARRELDSWFWPFVMWTYMTGLAYLVSLIVYQGGLALGFG